MSEPRAELGKALSNYLTPEQVSKLIDEILAIEKRRSTEFKCSSCGKRQMQWTTIPDAAAVTRSLTDLMSQAFGRPQEASNNTDPILFYRLTNVEELHAVRHSEESRGGQPIQHSEDGELRAEADEGAGLQQAESDPDLQEQHPEVPDPETLKTCRSCGETKPASKFPPRGRNARVCSDCRG